MAKHLAYLDGAITSTISTSGRLIVTMPPRHGKSQLCSQYLPAWYLGVFPDREVMLGSYESDFAASWGRKARTVLEEHGPSYFGVKVWQKSSAANRWQLDEQEGGMQTAGVGGPFTGKGADLLIIDDPVKGHKEARSETYRNATWDWYKENAYTRLSPNGAIIVIQTRWHEDDLTGRLLERAQHGGDQWTVVNLPALAEENDPLGRKVGEPLWPERYNLNRLLQIKNVDETSYSWSALYQQRPQPPEGGMFKREWFQFVDVLPNDPIESAVRYWDLAATKDGGDYSAATVVAKIGPLFYIDKVVRGQWSSGERQEKMDRIAELDKCSFGDGFVTWLPQDPGAAGKQVAELEARRLSAQGFPAKYELVSGDKVSRATPFAAACEHGLVRLVRGAWNKTFIDEHCAFDKGRHDDMVDATSSAYNKVAKPRSRFEMAVY